MKILVIHQYYLMPGYAGGSRFNEFARLWSAAGHEVTVIAGTLDYVTTTVPERYHRRWVTREDDGPVRVYRCHVPQTYGKSYAGRMWAFFGFTLSSLTAVVRQAVEERGTPDVIIATSPPLVAGFPGLLAKTLRGVPLVFEVRDLWPETAVTTGVLQADSALTKVLYKVEAACYRAADRINVLTPAFRDDIVSRGLAPASKICFIPNGADVELFNPGPRDNAARREFGWGDRFVVLYAGAHGRANAVHQLVDAAELLKDRRDILLATVGDGPERARNVEEAKKRGLDNIVFHGAQPKQRMPEIVNAADVGAAVLQNNPTFRTVYPNKVFDYMACERPTLLAIDGVARELVCDQARAGVFVEPENGRALADAVRKLADDTAGRRAMGERGRAWVLQNATRDGLARRYLDVLQELQAGRKAA